jgi:hypothetical protein
MLVGMDDVKVLYYPEFALPYPFLELALCKDNTVEGNLQIDNNQQQFGTTIMNSFTKHFACATTCMWTFQQKNWRCLIFLTIFFPLS